MAAVVTAFAEAFFKVKPRLTARTDLDIRASQTVGQTYDFDLSKGSCWKADCA
jgi:hypothetical protein